MPHPVRMASWIGGVLALALLSSACTPSAANEATIRKNLAERLPNLPPIEEVRPTPMRGLFEIRINGADILYTDAEGNYLIQGTLIDTRARANLTEQRIDQLTAIAFSDLPLADAFTTVRGNGQRKIAVFSDPNCGFCKRLERDLLKLDNITVYTFLVPMLGADSQVKSRNIWCARDKAAAYNDWMLNGVTPPNASCDTAALNRNLEFAAKHRITGTPTSFLSDGTRVVGADFRRIEQALSSAR
ncbi:DsbC family protein [Tepidicella xavieri]|uniref:Thiol:disulfide interchange protein n=1 Tax=Tepidicella xavieri TaxID=360241 RepID=A0A4V3D5Y1_9BURK|nr:thiol:disulfide interchange protein DsbC [Tepidicella xavieri]